MLARLGSSLSTNPSGTTAFLDAAYGRRHSPTLDRRRRRRLRKLQRVTQKQERAAVKIQALARGRQARERVLQLRAHQARLHRQAQEEAATAQRIEATARENQVAMEASRAAHVTAAVKAAELMAEADKQLAEAVAAEVRCSRDALIPCTDTCSTCVCRHCRRRLQKKRLRPLLLSRWPPRDCYAYPTVLLTLLLGRRLPRRKRKP